MDVLPSGGIFRELQVVHDTGYFSGQASLEEDWHQTCYEMERYLKDHEPQIKPEPLDHVLEFDNSWIKSEFEEDFGPIKHELIIKSEPSDQDDTDDDRLSLDELNIWDRGICNRNEDSYSSPGLCLQVHQHLVSTHLMVILHLFLQQLNWKITTWSPLLQIEVNN